MTWVDGFAAGFCAGWALPIVAVVVLGLWVESTRDGAR